MTNFIVIY